MHIYIRVDDIKTKFFVHSRRRELFFFLSFAGMTMGYIDHFKQGIFFSSSGITVSLFQTVFFQKHFDSSVWYKQYELCFTMVSEYFKQKCRSLARPNVSVLLLRRLSVFSFFNLSARDDLFSGNGLAFPCPCDVTITIHEYVWNRHRMFIYIYIENRNLETRKTLTTS